MRLVCLCSLFSLLIKFQVHKKKNMVEVGAIFFLVNKKWVEGVTIVTYLTKHDHGNTLTQLFVIFDSYER